MGCVSTKNNNFLLQLLTFTISVSIIKTSSNIHEWKFLSMKIIQKLIHTDKLLQFYLFSEIHESKTHTKESFVTLSTGSKNHGKSIADRTRRGNCLT